MKTSLQRLNLLPKGAQRFAAGMEKITRYLMAILRRTKASPWLLVKTAITIAAAKITVPCPPFYNNFSKDKLR